ncbi:pre-mRNA-splicing factor CWC22 homolog [Odontomachus brunneus]|uniref:pre-mRNA-splicing factor CWC22 homolog n=1 Tax=Odontomachus brunneus TaxID=486640 RepID=UPI0013F1D5BA|nr:pre-mRNA-splicing factor CWC22 homolog [Odontomachus brunneus]
MEKQKTKSQKDKLKEQNKSRESVIGTLNKSKDETEKKQTNSGEKSKEAGKSKIAAREKENTPVIQNIIEPDGNHDTKELSSKGEEKNRKGSTKKELKDQPYITDDSHVNHNKSDTKTKHKNKAGKNMKEGNGESAGSRVQQQTNVPSDDTKEKINIVDKSSLMEIAKSSDTQKAPLENIIERPSVTTKAESTTRQKDTSKKEPSSKSKTKSKELKLEVEGNNKNREKLENGVKEMLKNSSPESNKSLVDTEVKDPEPKVLDSAKVVEVNGNVKGKANSHKKDKASKERNETEAKESIENKRKEYRQTDAKLKIERAMSPESPEKIGENKAFISDTNDEKTEKRETEKGQTKTGKQKRSDKTKSNTQDTDKLKIDSSSKSLIELIAETYAQPAEETHFAKENVSVSDNSYLTQSKSDAKGTDVKTSVKTDEKGMTVNVQDNKRAPEATSKNKKKGRKIPVTTSAFKPARKIRTNKQIKADEATNSER